MKSPIIFTLIIYWLMGSSALFAQQKIQAGSMQFEAWLQDEAIEIRLEAATKGWLAVGFNDKNDIVHSDLLQFRVEDGLVYAEDQYVTGVGKHPKDTQLGGEDHIEILSGEEQGGKTSVRFRIPFNSGDRYDFPHRLDKDFWLILAYSVDKDFQHHSIMRKHFPYRWKKE